MFARRTGSKQVAVEGKRWMVLAIDNYDYHFER